MSARIHLVVDEADKERFRRQAAREGKSLSAWLRAAARDRLDRREDVPLDSAEALETFFAACDDRETGTEPDWEEHEAAIARSARSGDGGA